jgi:hypothetical protein
MRPEVIVRFWAHTIPGGAQTILGPAGCGPDVTVISEGWRPEQVRVEVTLLDTDERLPRLRALLERYGEPYIDGHVDSYTEEELDNARLLYLRPTNDCEVDGGVRFGTTYDLSMACSTCGAGARQTSALFLDGADDELPKLEGHRGAGTYAAHVLVDERLGAELEMLGFTGLLFHNVYALMPDKRQLKLRWKQISADRTLPRMSPQTTGFGMNQPCALCGRSGYMPGGDTRIAYRASDLEGAGDVNLAWEGYGYGELGADLRSITIPGPFLLVTPKVRRALLAAGVTEFDWKPIRVVDE